MRQAKVVVLGAIAVVAATAAGVVPAIVTGDSPLPAVSPSKPLQTAAGVGVDQGRSAPPPGGRAVSTSVVLRELAAFPSCETFFEHAQDQAIELVGPWGLPQYGIAVRTFLTGDAAVLAAEPGAAAVPPPPPASAPAPAAMPEAAVAPLGGSDSCVVETSDSAFSGTNVQEAGIDEPDIVKTNGTLMFVVTHKRLYALEAMATVPRVVDSIALEGWDHRLLLAGERVFVISRTDPHLQPYEEAAAERILPPSWPQTTITLIDAGDPGALHVVETLAVEGVFINARQIGSSVRVVVSSVPTRLEFTGPACQGRIGEVVATTLNRGVIRRTTVEDWLPGFVHHDRSSGEATTGLADCDGVRHPETFSGLGMLTVLTLDVESGVQPVDTDSVMTDGQLVYASTTSLYVATQQWLDWEEIASIGRGPGRIETVIHKFATDEPRRTEYRASGTVRGTLLNQSRCLSTRGTCRWRAPSSPAGGMRGPRGRARAS